MINAQVNNKLINNDLINNYERNALDGFLRTSELVLEYMNFNQIEKILLDTLTDKIIEETGNKKVVVTRDKISLVLEYMVKNNILDKEECGVVQTCPSCNGIVKHAECNECNSDKIVVEQMILHTNCGYIGDLNNFVAMEGLVCPQCGDASYDISELKNSEYRLVDTVYRCEDCGEEFKLYKTNGREYCDRCSNYFEARNSKIYNLDIYIKK